MPTLRRYIIGLLKSFAAALVTAIAITAACQLSHNNQVVCYPAIVVCILFYVVVFYRVWPGCREQWYRP